MISNYGRFRKFLSRPHLVIVNKLADGLPQTSFPAGSPTKAMSSSSIGENASAKAGSISHHIEATRSTTITPLTEKESSKSFFQRFYDRYSVKQQTSRILTAESFLQAATRQASDP